MSKNKKNLIRIAAIVAFILLPMMIYTTYSRITDVPEKIVIGTGPKEGQYRAIAKALKKEIKARHPDVSVELEPTEGSLENLLLLEAGKLDFALYQPGVYEAFEEHDPESLELAIEYAKDRRLRQLGNPGKTAFVANLYSQPVHLIIRQDAGIDPENLPQSLEGKSVALGTKYSGAYGMSMILLNHFGLKKDNLKVMYADAADYYEKVQKGFEEDQLDAAFITMGVRAQIFKILAETGKCEIIRIPNWSALKENNLYLSQYTIPAGLYGHPPLTMPRNEVDTVASGAQLLTRENANPYLVEAVTRIVLDKNFARKNHLNELFEGAPEFVRAKPEFPIHRGALSVYDPEFDIHVIEIGGALYSLVASVLTAAFFSFRWLRRSKTRRKEHKLDRYIRSLFDIERRQAPLDRVPKPVHIEDLQKLLAEVTTLRQEALREFTAHELSEDRGSDCFIEMCHALSNKINAKLSRQRLDIVMYELIEAVKGVERGLTKHSATASTEKDSTSPDRPD